MKFATTLRGTCCGSGGVGAISTRCRQSTCRKSQRAGEEEEIQRLLAACAASRNPHLTTIVTLALKEVQEILGHKTFSMTLRYAHLSPAHLRGAVDRLDKLTGSCDIATGVSTAHEMAQTAKIERAVSRKSLSSR